MSVDDPPIERRTFFGDPALDDDLPAANETFWAALIGHIEREGRTTANTVLDIGCHSGGLLFRLRRRFSAASVFGIEPLARARAEAARRLQTETAHVTLLDPSEWDRVPAAGIDLITSHETLYLVPDLHDFMSKVRNVLAPDGSAFVVLGCHSENPLWQQWKLPIIAAGHQVYDHAPLDVMKAAGSAGLLPSVQPLRRTGWITYDPLKADFHYRDIGTMFDHHYRHKLIYRLRIADDRTSST